MGRPQEGPECPHSPSPRAQSRGKASPFSRTPLSSEPEKSKQLLCDAIRSPHSSREKREGKLLFFLQNLGKTNLDLTFVSNPLSVNLPQAEHMPGAAE